MTPHINSYSRLLERWYNTIVFTRKHYNNNYISSTECKFWEDLNKPLSNITGYVIPKAINGEVLPYRTSLFQQRWHEKNIESTTYRRNLIKGVPSKLWNR
jgi:hypothetical protein